MGELFDIGMGVKRIFGWGISFPLIKPWGLISGRLAGLEFNLHFHAVGSRLACQVLVEAEARLQVNRVAVVLFF
jgi:hypothetical protein